MADDYTPTTADLREWWAEDQDRTHGLGDEAHMAEFDRWLAAHDAEKRAEWEAARLAELGEVEWGVGWHASWTDRVLGFATESRAEAEEHARQSNADPDDNLRYFVVQRTPERAPGWWVPVNENGETP